MTDSNERVEALWKLTGTEPAATDAPEFTGPERVLASKFAVTESAAVSIGAASVAAADLLATRGGPRQRVSIDRAHAAAAFSAERLLRIDGEPVGAWADLSGAYRTRDNRFLQLH